jgi:hypothetical protein
MLGGSLCHHFLARPRVADGGTASTYGGELRIYLIIIRGEQTMVGPPAWGLGVRLTTLHRKNQTCYETYQ